MAMMGPSMARTTRSALGIFLKTLAWVMLRFLRVFCVDALDDGIVDGFGGEGRPCLVGGDEDGFSGPGASVDVMEFL